MIDYSFKLDPYYIFDIITKNQAHHVRNEAIDHLKALGRHEYQLGNFLYPKNRYSDLKIDDGLNFRIIVQRGIGKANDWSVTLNFIDSIKNNLGPKIGMKPIFFNDSHQRFYLENFSCNEFYKLEKPILRNEKLKKLNLI